MTMWAGHEFVCGRTGSGKSVYAVKRGLAHAGPCLYIDPQEQDDLPARWPRTGSQNMISQILSLARRGGVVYVPDRRLKEAQREIRGLIGCLFAGRPWSPPLLLIVDEAQVFAPEGGADSPLTWIALRGRRWGVQGLFVSQRPAEVDKSVVTQCARHVVFQTAFEGPYFQRYGLPADDIRSRLSPPTPDHSYVVWDGVALTGPFKELWSGA